ncbi:GNAT family N-acetyltransferase [Prochlorococcus sp. MIT 1223]|uniref:GNAT family N-acetyltransferase n=1 Tax=Prochlorococcus sp. MIT 1223 TaxID=3096217 RepID=UPI002A75CB48|nr:GNAT family N-acetyltransferase [Prochlorococcus sp. MIT 1223]
MYNPYVVGDLVYLRQPTLEDVEGPWHEWFSDEELTRWLGRQFPNSKESQLEFFKSNVNSAGSNRIVLSIIDKKKDIHIGVCNLSSINWINRSCGIAIVIGNKDFQNGLYITESFSLLLKIIFLRLNLRIIKSTFLAGNKATVLMHKLFKFVEVGVIPNAAYDPVSGNYVDEVIAVLNRDEWLKVNNPNRE